MRFCHPAPLTKAQFIRSSCGQHRSVCLSVQLLILGPLVISENRLP